MDHGRGEADDLLIGPRATVTLKLTDLKRYDSGLLILTYQPERRSVTPPLAS